uniref:Uncharacterized protein n=1 Tax=Lophocladia kuetzingii TaxID=675577 RepID=A0A1Z1MPA4_9FLOR|nr:hypothetical protein [Lophocladia kuetzingii]ARW67689.1 hypothetical protein [Lophocladia kuetzingii]
MASFRSLRAIILCIGVFDLYKYAISTIEKNLVSFASQNNVIDVNSKPIKDNRKNFIKQIQKKN